jgi:hypothetical protein
VIALQGIQWLYNDSSIRYTVTEILFFEYMAQQFCVKIKCKDKIENEFDENAIKKKKKNSENIDLAENGCIIKVTLRCTIIVFGGGG